MYANSEIGAMGEEVAARWLADNGFEILERNWRAGRYELDIIARRGDDVHFVEVKTRKSGALTAPEEAITPAKFRSLHRAASAYLDANELDADARFDVVAVEYSGTRCTARYIPDAMIMRWKTY